MPDVNRSRAAYAVFTATAILLCAWFGSIFLRMDELSLRSGAPSLEATYHAAWTMKVVSEAPMASHSLLPSVVLDPVAGDALTWGATQPTENGGLIYTSFPPAGFIAPLGVLAALGLPPTAQHLVIFNAVAGLVTACIMALLLRETIRHSAGRRDLPVALSVLAPAFLAASYLWTSEALLAHGAIYWAQSISQAFLALSCLLFLRHQAYGSNTLQAIACSALCAAISLLEWTGYVFSAGLILILLFQSLSSGSRQRKQHLRLAAFIAGAVFAALIGTVIHYAVAIGFEPMLDTALSRAERRSGLSDPLGSLMALPTAYLTSFGLLIPLAAFAYLRIRRLRALLPPVSLTILAASFAMIENLVLMDHALSYSFDRLKFSLPLFMLIAAWIAMQSNARALSTAGACAAMIAMSGLLFYELRTAPHSDWEAVQTQNRIILSSIHQDPVSNCAIYGHEKATRGYLNHLLGRDIYERVKLRTLRDNATKRNACAIIYLEVSFPHRDLPRLENFLVYDVEGNLLRVSSTNVETPK